MSRPLRLTVLASGRGSNLQAIIDSIDTGRLNAAIVIVISDNEDAFALKRAAANKLPHIFLDPARVSNSQEYDLLLAEKIKQQGVDLVVLAGWMRLLGQGFLDKFPDQVINIHPSLLPAFPGLNAQKQAFEYGVKYTGCTVHFVDAGVDTGPIIAQQIVPIDPDDTLESLTKRILIEEHLLYPRVIQLFSENRIYKDGRKVRIK
ncbi:phosphoribosylglycinamide formyltransferase [Desulfitibacter alkalitolerans]|uniref:phosphoribosylglycinamide formyltransferase n=1 Tax=Desulfitibacter alkalitolerans TaxID=264641 RepID=UPI000488DEC1|nr:phosphoribosylglycinamide formyltransferase [Desulfitibacter alkalitolerans]